MSDQDKAIKLLRAIHADIEGCRYHPADKDLFLLDQNVIVEWPNISILSREIGKFLEKHDG